MAHKKQIDALNVVECVGNKFKEKFGRDSGGLVREYNLEKAETVIVTMGSVAGTIKDTIDELNKKGGKYGVLSIVSYRPFPTEAIRKALKNAKTVIVLEKAFAVGIGGILFQEISLALKNTKTEVKSVVAGLGGRAITSDMIKEYLNHKNHDDMVFLGLNKEIIEREYRLLDKGSCDCKSSF